MLIKSYIKNYLMESVDFLKLNSITSRLNKIAESNKSYNIEKNYYECINLISNLGGKRAGKGEFRDVWTFENQDWVIKFAFDKDGLDVNSEELGIAKGEYGIGVKDIFTKVYDFDKVFEKPCWIVCQKVMTLSDAKKILSIEVLKNIFPTFYNSLERNSILKSDAKSFCEFISYVLYDLSEYISESSSNDFKNSFYEAVVENAYNSEKELDDIVFYEDFNRIYLAYKDIVPGDMNDDNIGIILSNTFSPKNIAILDYLIK